MRFSMAHKILIQAGWEYFDEMNSLPSYRMRVPGTQYWVFLDHDDDLEIGRARTKGEIRTPVLVNEVDEPVFATSSIGVVMYSNSIGEPNSVEHWAQPKYIRAMMFKATKLVEKVETR